MNSAKENCQKQLEAFSFRLTMEEPVFGGLLSYFPRVWDEGAECLTFLPYAGTSFQMVLNPAYWKAINQQEERYGNLAAKVKHELLHLFCLHPFKRSGFKKKNLYDVACDLHISHFLLYPTVDSFLTEHFPQLTFEGCKNLTDYYSVLQKGEHLYPELNNIIISHQELIRDHQMWESYSSLTKGQIDLLQQKLRILFTQVYSKNNEQTTTLKSNSLFKTLETIIQQPGPINWRQALKQFATRTSQSKLVNSIRKPSKRYGSTPGLKIKSKKKLLVVIDTSGSVKQNQVQAFYQEVHRLWQLNFEFQILECDFKIRRTFKYEGVFPEVSKGGHMTDFNPPILYANEQFRPSGIIYFTDGKASAPKIQSCCPIFWVLVSDEKTTHKHLPGQKVYLPNAKNYQASDQ